MIDKKEICKRYGWDYNNFIQHIKGKTASKRTAEKYQYKLGGRADVWIFGYPGERKRVVDNYIIRQTEMDNDRQNTR